MKFEAPTTRVGLSKVPELISAVPAVVAEDMKTWTPITRPDGEGNEVESGFLNTPFGPMLKSIANGMESILIRAAKKSIYDKYGRSKYIPHSSAREVARRVRQKMKSKGLQ